MRASLFVVACLFTVSTHLPAQAQQKADFVNQELLSKQTPNEQYEAIRRGAVAQCRAEATTTAEKTFPPLRQCPLEMNPAAYFECERQRDAQLAQKQQLFKYIAQGCMAKQGWLLKAQQ